MIGSANSQIHKNMDENKASHNQLNANYQEWAQPTKILGRLFNVE